jgi:uncharacterized protein
LLIKSLLFVILSWVAIHATHADTLHITFKSNDLTLSGQVIAPANKQKKYPAIIFLAGSGGGSSYRTNYKDFISYFLHENLPTDSIVFMDFDKRGVGKSEGVWYKANFEDRAADAKAAADYLRTRPYVDASKILVVGHSQGGWIVQLCLSLYPETFAGGISMAGPTFSVKQQLINDYHSKLICEKNLDETAAYKKASRKVRMNLAFISIFPLNENWKQLNRIKKYENSKHLLRIKAPLLLMFGELDGLVYPAWSTKSLNETFNEKIPPTIEVHTSGQADHSFKISSRCYTGKSSALSYSKESKKVVHDWIMKNAFDYY